MPEIPESLRTYKELSDALPWVEHRWGLTCDRWTAKVLEMAAVAPKSARQKADGIEKTLDGMRLKLVKETTGDPSERVRQFWHGMEQILAECLGQHSWLYWLLAFRCMPPQDAPSPWQAGLIFNRFERATSLFLKHGSKSVQDVQFRKDGGLEFEFSESDFGLFLAIEVCTHELNRVPILYSHIRRGAGIALTGDGKLSATMSTELKNATNLWCERMERWNTVLSFRGLPLDIRTYPHLRTAGDDFVDEYINAPEEFTRLFRVVYYYPWIPLNTKPELRPSSWVLERTRFIPFTAILPKWVDALIKISAANVRGPRKDSASILGADGLTLEEFIWCWRAFNLLIGERERLFQASAACIHYLTMTGLLVIRKGVLRDTLAMIVHQLLEPCDVDPDRITMIVEKFLSFLEYDEEVVQKHDAMGRGVSGCLKVMGDYCLVDTPRILNCIIEALNRTVWSRDEHDRKGPYLEKHLADVVQQSCPRAQFPIAPSTKLFLTGNKRSFHELDLCVQIDDLLLLVECKARRLRDRERDGDSEALQRRWAKMNGILKESDQRAHEIALEHRAGRLTMLPHTITRLLPIVCTPNPEFIPYEEQEEMRGVWLKAGLPRVMTPGELIQFINELDPKDYYEHPNIVDLFKQ